MFQRNDKVEKTEAQKKAEAKAKAKAAARTLVIAGICVIAAAGFAVFGFSRNYLGGISGRINVYSQDASGDMVKAAELPRGIKIDKNRDKVTVADVEYTGIKLKASQNDESAEAIDPEASYFVKSQNIVRTKRRIVQETEVYARTPATIYAKDADPTIASFASKGTKLEVLGYDELLENGYVNRYCIAYSDIAGESGEGYVYGKYMVGTEEEALENYNEHGEYDTAVKAEYSVDLHGGHAANLDYYPVEKTQFEGRPLCTEARAMFLNSSAVTHPEPYLKLIKQTDCNAVVIDIKDGQLAYKSQIARKMSPSSYRDAYADISDYREGVKAFQDAGLYTIGRIVTFNDPQYAEDHEEDCIESPSISNWPSAYARGVWEYNIKLAIEAVQLFGFDEIQFDYVRFPETSYWLSEEKGTDWRNKYDEEKAQAIQNFCYYACDVLHEQGVYVSIDVFGECSSPYVTAYGQYWPSISNVVDVVSSMPYTDHFGEADTWTEPYGVINSWAKDTAARQKEIPTPAVDRTWITGYDTPYWNPTVIYNTAKMKQQIKGLTDAGLNGGFIPWNVLSDLDQYYQYKEIWKK